MREGQALDGAQETGEQEKICATTLRRSRLRGQFLTSHLNMNSSWKSRRGGAKSSNDPHELTCKEMVLRRFA